MLTNHKFHNKNITAPIELNGDSDDERVRLVIKGQVVDFYLMDVLALCTHLNIDESDLDQYRYNEQLNALAEKE